MLINVKPDGTVSERAVSEIFKALATHPGKVAQVDIKRYHPPRSNQQNRTVWGPWMDEVLSDKGYSPHDKKMVYDQIKIHIGWCDPKADVLTGEQVMIPRPTKNLNTAEYSDFMKIFRAFVEDDINGLGIRLEDPDSEKAKI